MICLWKTPAKRLLITQVKSEERGWEWLSGAACLPRRTPIAPKLWKLKFVKHFEKDEDYMATILLVVLRLDVVAYTLSLML